MCGTEVDFAETSNHWRSNWKTSSSIDEMSTQKLENGAQLPIAPDNVTSLRHDSEQTLSEPIKTQAEWVHLHGWRLVAGITTVFFGFVLAVIEGTITATALVTIGDHFNDQIRAQWVVIAYLLAYMSFSVIFARLNDSIGGRNALLLAWVLFSGFSLAGGLAQTLDQLIAFRTLQGIGGSGLFSLTFVVGISFTPVEHYAAFSATVGIGYAIASVLGPILGGVITQTSTWRWIYLLNAPCLIVAIAALILFVPTKPKASPSRDAKFTSLFARLARFDWLGSLLLISGSTLLVFALQEGGSSAWAWHSSVIICTLVFAILSWIGFVAWIGWLTYRKHSEASVSPIFPLSFILSRPTGPGLAVVFFTSFPYYIAIIDLPQRFQLVNGNGPIGAGVHLLPMLCFVALGSALGAGVSKKKNITAETTMVAAALILLACGLLSTVKDTHRIDPAIYGYQAILGLGNGLAFSALTLMTNINTEKKDNAAGQGAVSQARMLGGSIGLSVATIVFNGQLVDHLSSDLTPSQLKNLRQSLATISALPPALQLQVVDVYAKSFNQQMRICTYVSAAALIAAIATWQGKNRVNMDDIQAQRTLMEKPGEKVGDERDQV